jgi:Zn-dependent protease
VELNLIYIAIVIIVILFSMTLHEAMHGFMAFWLGDDTAEREGRLTLNPIKHIDPFLTLLLPVMLAIIGGPIFGGAKPVPFNPARLKYDEWGAALVALAGPLTNLVVAFVAFASATVMGVNVADFVYAGLNDLFLSLLVTVNLGFFVFNMLPLPPLDGSRVLYALAPDFVRRGMEAIEQFGIVFIFAIVLLASSVIGGFMRASITGILQAFSTLFGM